MDTVNFLKILAQPKNIQSSDIDDLQAVITAYPYMQSARAMHLKGLKITESVLYNTALKTTAAYTSNRDILFDFITSKTFLSKTIEVKNHDDKTLKNEVLITQNTCVDDDLQQYLDEIAPAAAPDFFEVIPEKNNDTTEDNTAEIDTTIADTEFNDTLKAIPAEATAENLDEKITINKVQPSIENELDDTVLNEETESITDNVERIDLSQFGVKNGEALTVQSDEYDGVNEAENKTKDADKVGQLNPVDNHVNENIVANKIGYFETLLANEKKLLLPPKSLTKDDDENLDKALPVSNIESSIVNELDDTVLNEETESITDNVERIDLSQFGVNTVEFSTEQQGKHEGENDRVSRLKPVGNHVNENIVANKTGYFETLLENEKNLLLPIKSIAKDETENQNLEISTKATVLEQTPEETLQLGKPLEFNENDSYSFSEWLKLSSFKPIDRRTTKTNAPDTIIDKPVETVKIETEEVEQLQQKRQTKFDLIDKFIATNPKIKPIKHKQSTGKSESKNIAKAQKLKPKALMTETLARIYLEQQNYDKAIQSYTILSLKYPEKSDYFANQILAIKKLQKQNK